MLPQGSSAPVFQRFTKALDALVDQLKEDRAVLAVVLCGSLAHDTVWERSDIDLTLITVDDKKGGRTEVTLSAAGIPVHAMLLPRTEFRQLVESALRNSFMHSFVAKGRLLYSHDPTIGDMLARLNEIGEADSAIQLLHAAANALPLVDKAHKWFVTRGDLDYTALWILHAAVAIARIEVVGRRLLADREVIIQAMPLNPPLFKTIYTDLLNGKKTAAQVQAALDAVDGYLAGRAADVFGPVLEHLREAGEARAGVEIDDHFRRHGNVQHVSVVCEYLATLGLIGKAAIPVRLTRRSTADLQELAFFFIEPPPAPGRGRTETTQSGR